MNDMDKAKEEMAFALFGRSRTLAIAGSQCVKCGGLATDFRDELSRKEHGISGFCQTCQDSIFGEAAEDEVEDDFQDMMPTSEEFYYPDHDEEI